MRCSSPMTASAPRSAIRMFSVETLIEIDLPEASDQLGQIHAFDLSSRQSAIEEDSGDSRCDNRVGKGLARGRRVFRSVKVRALAIGWRNLPPSSANDARRNHLVRNEYSDSKWLCRFRRLSTALVDIDPQLTRPAHVDTAASCFGTRHNSARERAAGSIVMAWPEIDADARASPFSGCHQGAPRGRFVVACEGMRSVGMARATTIEGVERAEESASRRRASYLVFRSSTGSPHATPLDERSASQRPLGPATADVAPPPHRAP